jgi:ribose 5-phosphate isomerase A
MGDSDQLKRAAARAALEYVRSDTVIGVGTGSTASAFIEELARAELALAGAVASSTQTRERLARHKIPVIGLNEAGRLPLYVDGADEVDHSLRLIKGGGGALTREKIVASASDLFVCIADETKLVERFGGRPVPLEVISMAREQVIREVGGLGGRARPRTGFVTDNGNEILDVEGLDLTDPLEMESALEMIPGVVACGLFVHRPADVLLLGTHRGVRRLERPASGPTSDHAPDPANETTAQ